MSKTEAFHILNHGEKHGALKVAKSIKKTKSLNTGYGFHGHGAYAHYYENVDKKCFRNFPMVIFCFDRKRTINIKSQPFDFIVIEGEDSVPIEIIEFRNIPGKS